MGVGHVTRGAAAGDNLVGDAGTCRYAEPARLVRLRLAVGICIDDQSFAGQPVAAAARLGCVSRVEKRRIAHRSRPLLACAIAVLCCVPWTVRNYLAFHRFIPLRSNLPFELWLGNNEQFDEQSQVVPPSDPERFEIRNYVRMGETAFMQDKWQKAIGFMRTHPRLEITLFARRFVATWTGVEKPIESFRDTDSPLVRLVLVSNTLAALGALCGILALLRSRSIVRFSAGSRADRVSRDLLRDAHFAALQAPD